MAPAKVWRCSSRIKNRDCPPPVGAPPEPTTQNPRKNNHEIGRKINACPTVPHVNQIRVKIQRKLNIIAYRARALLPATTTSILHLPSPPNLSATPLLSPGQLTLQSASLIFSWRPLFNVPYFNSGGQSRRFSPILTPILASILSRFSNSLTVGESPESSNNRNRPESSKRLQSRFYDDSGPDYDSDFHLGPVVLT
ncbi:hypothetical protein C8F04DRAFT_1242318 [Mycena alexandri]|uniref:Uncharacterized protein n=1 Tax=Mycena alexandri TaxID=1745969 RepID=A0AAD6S2E2_9AGAR|nr:hypothetical protein C8F04DRAFT_1200780 [Mycena alexandri]KAJ7019981.1 hypothetical protein C8F04DRAFT_1242318 [Mycena alexandri]